MENNKSKEDPNEVLVVEDSKVFASFFIKVFHEWHYPCKVIADGDEAWSCIRQNPPKILILDWNLPGLDGISICRKLRQLELKHYVYVIMLTSNASLEHAVTGFDAGADDYITKPFKAPILKAKLKVASRLIDLEENLRGQANELAAANRQQETLIESLREKNRIITRQKQELHEAQKQVIDTARKAGMAEIATSVLHNVGNLLNTAMTSSNFIGEVMAHSRIGTLSKLADLMGQQAPQFIDFVKCDPRGQKLPEFIQQLSQVLGKERVTMLDKLNVLSESHDQIRQIIALQQNYAGISGVKERVDVKGLVQDASRLFAESFKKHDITIEYRIEDGMPEIALEKHKVLQILMNLLRNARDATKLNNHDGRLLIVRASRRDDGVDIQVIDNGIGISAENMPRIFNFGFTTKNDGHGFGLHSCANLAREIGGSLHASSDGLGKGATFTLFLPFGESTQNPV